MKREKIAIFYHVLQYGTWKEVYEEQIVRLQQSGLYDSCDYINVCVNGQIQMPFNLDKVNLSRNVEMRSEIDTLTKLYEFTNKNPEYKILYMNNLGVTWHDTKYYENKVQWRRYLEYFNIERWKKCVELLNENDCVGTEWYSYSVLAGNKVEKSVYSGNFWWANASYVNRLDLNFLKEAEWGRFNCELWLGTGNPKSYSFYQSSTMPGSLYITKIMREQYENV